MHIEIIIFSSAFIGISYILVPVGIFISMPTKIDLDFYVYVQLMYKGSFIHRVHKSIAMFHRILRCLV